MSSAALTSKTSTKTWISYPIYSIKDDSIISFRKKVNWLIESGFALPLTELCSAYVTVNLSQDSSMCGLGNLK